MDADAVAVEERQHDDAAVPEHGGTTKPTILSPNQLVAYNLARARRLRGWTQEEAAERLEHYLGVRWSKVVFSAAESSVDNNRGRRFDADEIFAFARTFRLPPMWFFLPPGRDETEDVPLTSSREGEDHIDDVLAPDELLHLNLRIGQRPVVAEILHRVRTYEQDTDLTIIGHATLNTIFHLHEWGRGLIASVLNIDDVALRLLWLQTIRNHAKGLIAHLDAAIAQEGQD